LSSPQTHKKEKYKKNLKDPYLQDYFSNFVLAVRTHKSEVKALL